MIDLIINGTNVAIIDLFDDHDTQLRFIFLKTRGRSKCVGVSQNNFYLFYRHIEIDIYQNKYHIIKKTRLK